MTQHCIKRAKERAYLNETEAKRFITKATICGKPINDFPNRERKYLSSKVHGDAKPVVYNNYCFIVNENDICITMYPLPDWFGKKEFYNKKEKIRKPKKYFNMYCTGLEMTH